MFETIGVKWKWGTLAVLDRVITSPFVRWSWSGQGEQKFPYSLSDYRPCDSETVREMMSGRYLFASRLVDTHGASPFSARIAHVDWRTELNNFSWLRHFRDVRDEGERRFARMLVLDWIGRHRHFEREMWDISVTAQRVMNWLRHLNLLLEDAGPDQKKLITGLLFEQVQSLKMRIRFARDPADALMARIAVAAAALCDDSPAEQILDRLASLEALLETHIDEDGMHKSRNPAVQIKFLTELVTLRHAVAQRGFEAQSKISALVKRMQHIPAALTLGTGELGYFNGCGQQPVDLVYALNAQGNNDPVKNGVIGGYGILRDGAAMVVADSGQVPEIDFALTAHAGASSFEFSHGPELIVGNCGPAPAEQAENAALFRLGVAHSCPTLGHHPISGIVEKGAFAGRMIGLNPDPEMTADAEDISLQMTNPFYRESCGIMAERWLTLMSNGDTLVGQDKFSFTGEKSKPVPVSIRFHLGPGVEVQRQAEEDILRLKLPSGNIWSFLWEGATVSVDDSVRQSAYFGFHRTKQIVVETVLQTDSEIAWILTRSV